MVLFTAPGAGGESSWSGHAAVLLQDGSYFDIQGRHASKRELLEEYSHLGKSEEFSEEVVSAERFNEVLKVKPGASPLAELDDVERAALAKISFDLICDYGLD